MYNWIVDWEEFKLIENYVQDGDTVFDIGTNMGFYTLWMSRFVGKNGKIHCFEPDVDNFKRLEINLSINKIEGFIRTNQCAVSDSEGLLKFTYGKDGENHIIIDALESYKTVQSIVLDRYTLFQEINQISYMKIDVEGFEFQVLKGSERLLLNKQIDIIQLEINEQLNNACTKVEDLLLLLETYGYSLFSYDVSLRTLLPIEYKRERENYFAIADIQKINSRLQSIL